MREVSIKKGLLDDSSRGLDNSLDNLMGGSLKNLKVSKDELSDLYRRFPYYVYVNKLFWPLIKYINREGIVARGITFLLTGYLKVRFMFIP